ncbi:hypothetical protein GCM10022247_33000 [Allokutzneria multivorans]|uniref:Uncharacterized protein n=1 Tax=Allokutzneria multivorans TaxID=1142134 RepID=A0ABP7S8A5_9PSEU
MNITEKRSGQALLLLTILFGATVGVLGMLDSAATGVVAIIGAIVLGGLWTIRGILSS